MEAEEFYKTIKKGHDGLSDWIVKYMIDFTKAYAEQEKRAMMESITEEEIEKLNWYNPKNGHQAEAEYEAFKIGVKEVLELLKNKLTTTPNGDKS